MDWFERAGLIKSAEALYGRLREERVIWDTAEKGDLEVLRRDAARIAADMDDPRRPPPMFWSGIPWPAPGPEPSCDYQVVISVGGTKTDFALLRLDRGQVFGLDVRAGREVSSAEDLEALKEATQMPTPKHSPATPTGEAMVAAVVRHFAELFGERREALERCEAVFLSWGFPHRVIRTGPAIAGGLTARITSMTKDQAGFSRDLMGKDVDPLFAREFRAQLGWERPIAVANDTVMALHYFLDPARRKGHGRVGLFINGTGTNFAAAEPYAVRREGFICAAHQRGPGAAGEDYEPERIVARRPLRPGEREEPFFVNYETGSIELSATRTRFDVDPEYPIERNALAGGNAFSQMLRALVEEMISPELYERIRAAWAAQPGHEDEEPGAPAVSILARLEDHEPGPHSRVEEVQQLVQKIVGADLPGGQQLRLIARAIIARSALHAALVLAAVTLRTGFGRGRDGLPDLLGMEGSVWKISGYPGLVRSYWKDLVGDDLLQVTLAAEPSYNASLSGPLYLAAIHRRAAR